VPTCGALQRRQDIIKTLPQVCENVIAIQAYAMADMNRRGGTPNQD
jgi:hypothetical protein